ncbi:hypothetical protein HK096_001984 [Nowakowskiella sp. JEL0078]|nr:hypothetical protein HK096_001984 [Nowakowskiella sp. JEL0078]
MFPLLSLQEYTNTNNASSAGLLKERVEEIISTPVEQKVVKASLMKSIQDTVTIQNAKIVTAVHIYLLNDIIPRNKDPVISNQRQYAMQTFCTRILTLTKSSTNVVYVSLLYVRRLAILSCMNTTMVPHFASSQASGLKLTPRQLMTVSLMLAHKYLEDRRFSAVTWSKISGVDVKELNSAERECLAALQFDLFVSEQEFFSWNLWLYQFVVQMGTQ